VGFDDPILRETANCACTAFMIRQFIKNLNNYIKIMDYYYTHIIIEASLLMRFCLFWGVEKFEL